MVAWIAALYDSSTCILVHKVGIREEQGKQFAVSLFSALHYHMGKGSWEDQSFIEWLQLGIHWHPPNIQYIPLYNVNLMHLRLIVPWLASNQTCNTHVHERHLTIFQRNRGFKAKKGCLKIRIRFKFVVFSLRTNFSPGFLIIWFT